MYFLFFFPFFPGNFVLRIHKKIYLHLRFFVVFHGSFLRHIHEKSFNMSNIFVWLHSCKICFELCKITFCLLSFWFKSSKDDYLNKIVVVQSNFEISCKYYRSTNPPHLGLKWRKCFFWLSKFLAPTHKKTFTHKQDIFVSFPHIPTFEMSESYTNMRFFFTSEISSTHKKTLTHKQDFSFLSLIFPPSR